jgi:hypothetical protein
VSWARESSAIQAERSHNCNETAPRPRESLRGESDLGISAHQRRVLVLDYEVERELDQSTKTHLQILEVHESVESVADLSVVQRLIGHRVVDGTLDRFADADAQMAVTEAGVDRSAVIEGALPL